MHPEDTQRKYFFLTNALKHEREYYENKEINTIKEFKAMLPMNRKKFL